MAERQVGKRKTPNGRFTSNKKIFVIIFEDKDDKDSIRSAKKKLDIPAPALPWLSNVTVTFAKCALPLPLA